MAQLSNQTSAPLVIAHTQAVCSQCIRERLGIWARCNAVGAGKGLRTLCFEFQDVQINGAGRMVQSHGYADPISFSSKEQRFASRGSVRTTPSPDVPGPRIPQLRPAGTYYCCPRAGGSCRLDAQPFCNARKPQSVAIQIDAHHPNPRPGFHLSLIARLVTVC